MSKLIGTRSGHGLKMGAAIVLAAIGFIITSFVTEQNVDIKAVCLAAPTALFVTDHFQDKIGWPLTVKTRQFSLSDCDSSLHLEHSDWQVHLLNALIDIIGWVGVSVGVIYGGVFMKRRLLNG